MKREEELLLQGDEVLLSLTHRAAFNAIKLVPIIGYLVGVAVLILVRSHIGITIGLTTICFAFLASLIFELTLGYYGVSRGLAELKQRNVVSRSAAIKRTVMATVQFMYVWFSVSYFAMNDSLETAILETLGGAVIVVILMTLRYRRRLVKIKG